MPRRPKKDMWTRMIYSRHSSLMDTTREDTAEGRIPLFCKSTSIHIRKGKHDVDQSRSVVWSIKKSILFPGNLDLIHWDRSLWTRLENPCHLVVIMCPELQCGPGSGKHRCWGISSQKWKYAIFFQVEQQKLSLLVLVIIFASSTLGSTVVEAPEGCPHDGREKIQNEYAYTTTNTLFINNLRVWTSYTYHYGSISSCKLVALKKI